MPTAPTEKIWMNGELVAWEDAKIHVLTHSLHYGMGVFEGVRAYETKRGPAVFRLTDHMQRLHNSARIMLMDLPYTVDELVEFLLRIIQSMVVAPPEAPRSGAELRAYLRRWVGPAIS